MITVRIPTPLRTLTGGNEQVEVEAATVREAIDALAEPRPFAHAAFFHHAVTRRHAAGAWRALRAITELVKQPTA